MPKFSFRKIFIIFSTFIIINILFIDGFVFAAGISKFSLRIKPIPQCMDNIDNDGDGKIDYPDDQECVSVDDNFEGIDNARNATSVINIQGYTIPNSKVKIFKDGQVISHVKSDNTGAFSQQIYGVYSGKYNFGLIAETTNKLTTNINNFNVELTPGNYISVTNAFLAPTIETSQSVYKQGEDVLVSGNGLVDSYISIFLKNIKSGEIIPLTTIFSDKDGSYSYKIDTKNISKGNYLLYANNILENENIGTSKVLNIELSESTSGTVVKHRLIGDLNIDDKVNFTDFSILKLHWLGSNYKDGDLNSDGIIDIKDFSIMAYYWTGD